MTEQPDLFTWALSQPTAPVAEIIDARRIFDRRFVETARAVVAGRIGRCEGTVIYLAAARQRAKVGPAGSYSPPPSRASGPAA